MPAPLLVEPGVLPPTKNVLVFGQKIVYYDVVTFNFVIPFTNSQICSVQRRSTLTSTVYPESETILLPSPVSVRSR
jgi:hypothetical protein